MNGATFATGFVAGGNGQAFSFDGNDDWINVPSPQVASTFTIEGWVFIGPVSSGYRTIYADDSLGFWLFNRRLNWWQGGAKFSGNTLVPANEWHHIALTYDGNTFTGYLDGALDGTSIFSGASLPSSASTGIGGHNQEYFDGRIDELAVYDRALQAAEIQAIFNAGSLGKCATPTYDTFGAGCPGTVGIPTLDAAPNSLPQINGAFTVQLDNLPMGSPGAFVIFGFSNTNWAGFPLPLDLAQFGIVGCTVYISVEVAFPAVISGTTAQFSVNIPADPSLMRVPFFNQALVLDPLANPFGGVVTNAAEGLIGVK